MSHTGGRGVDPEIMSSNAERCRVCVGPTQNVCYEKQVLTSQKQRMFQEEDGFDFRDAATRRLISAELRRFSPDSVTVHPPISRRCVASANPWSIMRAVRFTRTIEKRETGLPGCALACVDPGSRQCDENSSNGEVKSSNLWEVASLGKQCDQKTWCHVRSPVDG